MARRGDLRQTPELSERSDRIQSLPVTRVGTRLLAMLVAAALAAVLLAACGGSDSEDSTSTSGNSTAPKSQAEAKAELKERVEEAKRKLETEGGGSTQKQGGGSGSPSSGSNAGGPSTKNVETPLKVSGGGSEQFRAKGGDNSIQEYGEEGDESELQEVAEIVHGFYVARAEEKWDEACSYLAKSNVEQLEQLASQSPQFKGKGCGPILKAFTRPLSAEVQREITTVDAGSFRHDGEQGFLIYYGAEKTVYAMPLRNEDGTWQVAALSGSAIG